MFRSISPPINLVNLVETTIEKRCSVENRKKLQQPWK